MGQAKQRGTYEQRKAAGIVRQNLVREQIRINTIQRLERAIKDQRLALEKDAEAGISTSRLVPIAGQMLEVEDAEKLLTRLHNL